MAEAIIIDPVEGVVEQAVTPAAEEPPVAALDTAQVQTKDG